MSQLRINMNRFPDDDVPESLDFDDDVESISCDPLIDVRDGDTLWLWVAANVCVELSFEEICRMKEAMDEVRNDDEDDS